MEESKPQPLAEKTRRVAVLHLEFDLDNLVLNISGQVPNNATSLDMARRLLDECQWRAHLDWQAQQGPRIVDGRGAWPARFGRG
jgi:hypothetical protein